MTRTSESQEEYRIPCRDRRFSLDHPYMCFFRSLRGDSMVRLETTETDLEGGTLLPNGCTRIEGIFAGFVVLPDEVKFRIRPGDTLPITLSGAQIVGKPEDITERRPKDSAVTISQRRSTIPSPTGTSTVNGRAIPNSAAY